LANDFREKAHQWRPEEKQTELLVGERGVKLEGQWGESTMMLLISYSINTNNPDNLNKTFLTSMVCWSFR